MREGYLRIGEVSRRTGVPPEVLRAWEARYGLLRPDRSPGGFRLYGEHDVARVTAMRRHLGEGLSAAQAAARALDADIGLAGADAPARREQLGRALQGLDELAAHAVLDAAVSALSVDALVGEIVLPYLAELGRRWEDGDASVAEEHFASAVLRGRLLGLARGWGQGGSPHALLACAPDEEHDLPLICLGLALRGRGWRVTFLGARTPLDTLIDTARLLAPDVCVVSATLPRSLEGSEKRLRALAKATTLTIAGPGADAEFAKRVGATWLDAGPVEAAARLG